MTARTRITDTALRQAARIAAETGVEVTIEAGGKVYRIAPKPATVSTDDGYAAWQAKRGRGENPRPA